MKTTYYLTLHGNAKVLRATTSIAKIKLARCANNGLWCKAVEPKTARKMIEDGVEFIKVQDLY